MMTRINVRIFLFIMLMAVVCRSWADTYDPLLLRAQASIFPKIILLDQDLNRKTPGDEVVLTIVSMDRDLYIAQQLSELMADKYGSRLGNKKLTVKITTFEDFDENAMATSYIVLHGPESSIKKVVSHASSRGRIVFSYSFSSFIYQALVSVYVKEKTYIYLNKSAVQLYGIKFLPVFYKITKIIE